MLCYLFGLEICQNVLSPLYLLFASAIEHTWSHPSGMSVKLLKYSYLYTAIYIVTFCKYLIKSCLTFLHYFFYCTDSPSK